MSPYSGVAYGRRFRFDVPVPDLDHDGATTYDEVSILHGQLPPGELEAPERLDDDVAKVRFGPGRRANLERRAATAAILGSPLAGDELAHPYLHVIAAVFARWDGAETYHAGAFVANGVGWGVVGGTQLGKSTLMAALAASGVPVLTDDLMICDGERIYAGPRCVDLRVEPAAHSRAVRDGTRWRVPLGPVADKVPLGGWVFLDWGDALRLERIPAAELLALLARVRRFPHLASSPALFLRLARKPAYRLSRPRDLARLPAVIQTMTDLTAM